MPRIAFAGLSFKRQVELPVAYKGLKLDCGYKIDLIVQDEVILGIENHREVCCQFTKPSCSPTCDLAQKRVGFLINFNVPLLTQGIVRRVL